MGLARFTRLVAQYPGFRALGRRWPRTGGAWEVRHAKRPAVPGGALPWGPWGRGGGGAGTPLEEASRLNQQAVELYQAGRYPEALPLPQRALELYEPALGSEHPDIAASLNNLAGLYQAMGAFDQALPLCQRALEIRKERKKCCPLLTDFGLIFYNISKLIKFLQGECHETFAEA